jgi:hypothetical protein
MFSTYIVLHLYITSYTLTQCVKNIVKLIYTYIQCKPKSIYMHKSGLYIPTPLWSFARSWIEILAKLTYIPLPRLNFQKPKYPDPIGIFSKK